MQLSQSQAKHAAIIVSEGRALGMSARDIQIAIMTALTESSLQMYANSSVPQSLSYSHDAIGHDTDSLGLFQQRPSAGWGSVSQLMNASYDAQAFYKALKKDGARVTQSPWIAAQTVQVSAFSDGSNYQANWQNALGVYAQVTNGPLPPAGGTTNPAGNVIPGVPSPLDLIAPLGTILGDISQPGFWKRAGVFALGGVLILIALITIIHESGVVSSAVNSGKKVAKTAGEVAAVIPK